MITIERVASVVESHIAFPRAGAKEVALRPHPDEFYLYSEL